MKGYAESEGSGSTVLDYLETAEGKQRLYKLFTEYKGVCKQDLTQVTDKLQNEMKEFAHKLPQYEEGLHLDTFLPDHDIKNLLKRHIGCNSWNGATIGVCKACYKDAYRKDMLPQWSSIVMESLKK